MNQQPQRRDNSLLPLVYGMCNPIVGEKPVKTHFEDVLEFYMDINGPALVRCLITSSNPTINLHILMQNFGFNAKDTKDTRVKEAEGLASSLDPISYRDKPGPSTKDVGITSRGTMKGY